MRKLFVGLVAVFSLGMNAGMALSSDKNPTDYTQTAHVLGTAKHHTPGGTTSTYNSQTGQWSHGSYSSATQRETELRIGNMVYVVRGICKQIEVGKDYPAMVEKNKIHLLLSDTKTCDARIESTHEAE
jgi:hypothetical protein